MRKRDVNNISKGEVKIDTGHQKHGSSVEALIRVPALSPGLPIKLWIYYGKRRKHNFEDIERRCKCRTTSWFYYVVPGVKLEISTASHQLEDSGIKPIKIRAWQRSRNSDTYPRLEKRTELLQPPLAENCKFSRRERANYRY